MGWLRRGREEPEDGEESWVYERWVCLWQTQGQGATQGIALILER